MADYVNAEVVVPDINGWLQTLNSYAVSASSSATDLADKLSSHSGITYDFDTDFKRHTPNIEVSRPARISSPSLSLPDRIKPSDLILEVPNLNLSDTNEPILEATSPSLNLPNTPSELSVSLPDKNFTLDLDKEFPVAPVSDLPDVPTLITLDLPDPINIANPIFEGVLPDSSSIIVPGNIFSYNENFYNSDLLDKVKSELSDRLSESTGLNPAVEAALWNRERDREQTALLQNERTLLTERASSGLSRPSGATLAALDEIVQQNQNKIIELSREIMIKQAELEQDNIKFSIQQSISLENILLREHNNVQQRSFEVARYIQDIAIELYKALISKYNSEVEAYKASAAVFQARIQAELSKVEIYKAEIDAQKVRGEINEQNINVYLAQIDAIKSTVDIYKIKVSAVSEELRAEGLKIDAYKTEVDAYSSSASAKAEEYRAYSENIKGELAKVDVFDSQVKAFATRLEGYSISKNLEIKQAELKMEGESLRIKKYLADIEGFISEVNADQQIYKNSVDIFRGELQAYLADVNYNISVSDIALKESEIITDQNKFEANSSIEKIKIKANQINSENDGRIEGLKAAGNIHSQLAVSSLNAVNVSASAGGEINVELSEHYQHSLSTS